MTTDTAPDPEPAPLEPADAWWDVPRFSGNDVMKLLMEYGEQRADHARKVVLDLARRIEPR